MVFAAQWVCTHRCSRLGEADNGELAGDVNRRAGKADVPADGGIIDDGTATGPKYGRDFVLHRQQHATDVDIADLMVVLDRLLGGEQAELALGAGVVERDVQSAVGADGLFDERDDVTLSADIVLYEQGASTARSDLPGDLLSLGNPPAGDDHIRAFFGKRQGSGFADAAPAGPRGAPTCTWEAPISTPPLPYIITAKAYVRLLANERRSGLLGEFSAEVKKSLAWPSIRALTRPEG